MHTLLIVEDEKLIRKGMATMAARCSVHIDEIIESRNGVEALEILKSRRIDTVFMDIRMPKMDGLELIRHIDELEEKPDVVVLSGYDDFNYAVEMLKHGVFDYVLKPVKRETVEELLTKLEKKQKKNIVRVKKEIQLLYHQIKFMLSSNMSAEEIEHAQKQYRDIYGNQAYVIVCAPQGGDVSEDNFQGVLLENIKGQDILLMPESLYEKWRQETQSRCYGVSCFHDSFSECSLAYQEALHARAEAFMRCQPSVQAESSKTCEPTEEELKEAEQFVEQFVRQLSTKDWEASLKRLEQMYFDARHKRRPCEPILDMTENIQKMIVEAYQSVVPEDKKSILRCESALSYIDADEFMSRLKQWMTSLVHCLSDEFVYDQNKRKIRMALEYIHENYQKDLNMAQVSNHVCMNYSLFSLTFKEYTGVNFVNYLKDIRIREARRLLAETDWKISDISHKVGYENDKHFMKIFKNICGVSPSDYRKNML